MFARVGEAEVTGPDRQSICPHINATVCSWVCEGVLHVLLMNERVISLMCAG